MAEGLAVAGRQWTIVGWVADGGLAPGGGLRRRNPLRSAQSGGNDQRGAAPCRGRDSSRMGRARQMNSRRPKRQRSHAWALHRCPGVSTQLLFGDYRDAHVSKPLEATSQGVRMMRSETVDNLGVRSPGLVVAVLLCVRRCGVSNSLRHALRETIGAIVARFQLPRSGLTQVVQGHRRQEQIGACNQAQAPALLDFVGGSLVSVHATPRVGTRVVCVCVLSPPSLAVQCVGGRRRSLSDADGACSGVPAFGSERVWIQGWC